MHLSLMEECRSRVERALATLEVGASRDAHCEMKLRAALGASLILTKGATALDIGAAWTRALEIAEGLDDPEYQSRSLWGLWTFHVASGRQRAALDLGQRFYRLAAKQPDPNHRLIGEQMIGISQHYLGDQDSARRHIEPLLTDYVTPDHRSHIIRFQIDQRVVMRVFLARILWLQRFPDQAMSTAESSVEHARQTNHTISLCYALAQAACPIALLVGDLAAAEHYVGMLLDHSTRHVLARWSAVGRIQRGLLVIKRGDVVTGLRLLRAGFDELGGANSPVLRLIVFLIAEALGRAGQIADGLAAVEEALAWTERTEERWVMAELLRVKGELVLLQGAQAAAATAEHHFRQALDWARRQGALSWELRTATSLARLLCDQGRSADASALLQPVYDRFTEGFDTADLKAAKALLDALR
jgi:predicted ATPase